MGPVNDIKPCLHKHSHTTNSPVLSTSIIFAVLPRVIEAPRTNTTLTFPSDPLLTVKNSKREPRAMNQMSVVALWWNHINI